MNELGTIFDQARLFAEQHAPENLMQETMPIAVVLLVAGVGLSVFGAKLSRFGTTSLFGIAGAYLGLLFAQMTSFPTVVCSLAGAVMVGIIGYHTFRLWVGLMTAAVLSIAVLSAFSYQRVLPHVAPFEQRHEVAGSTSPGAEARGPAPEVSFALPTPEAAQAYRERTPLQWAQELRSYINSQDAEFEAHVRALALGSILAGLCLGVLAVRWALILSTALIGTALVTGGIAGLMAGMTPDVYQAFQARPGLAGGGMGAFLVTSIIVQTMLTRTAKPAKSSSGKA